AAAPGDAPPDLGFGCVDPRGDPAQVRAADADLASVLSRGGGAEDPCAGLQRHRAMLALQDGATGGGAVDRAGGLRGPGSGLPDGPYHLVLPGGARWSAPVERGGGDGLGRGDGALSE